ncbi:hypothetical protein [Sphingomonas sanxanigenens]|uniref:Uncharacterized protein n=1 Tax=Sphingomonas sanxanigenens DSM 19645 = NX02 TaxID=1123269 RepID=W0A354_9SPHN|nr:hypothetical protein [Sphingomonas sanxanigenens]AHE52379.1 hypothetical protein NX02_03120 [Sphingomonas sanxanigenens DSM 19645 = NX02]
MQSAQEILALLKARGVTQAEIARVLGVAQPNVATLYNPAKTGRRRKLGYDEAVALIAAFDLDAAGDGAAEGAAAGARTSPPPAPAPISAAALAPVLQALVPLAPPGPLSASAAEALALALRHALQLLPSEGSTEPSSDQIAMAARAAALRFREALPS